MTTTNTKTVKSSGGDYTSLSNWEAGRQADLVALDYIEVAECYSFADVASITISGWTTDTTRYIKIYTPISERHNGKWNTGKYRLEIDMTSRGIAIDIDEDFVIIEGIQLLLFGVTGTYGTAYGIDINGCINSQIFKSIIRSTMTGTATKVGIIDGNTGAAIRKIWNNIIYDFTGYGIRCFGGGTGNSISEYNNTVYGCGVGFALYYGSNMPILKNNLAYGNTDNYNYPFHSSSTNNLSGPGSDANMPATNARNGVTVTFVDEVGDDFHLASTDIGALGYGINLYNDGTLPFQDDIDGEDRGGSGAAWDIGTDEYVALTGIMQIGSGGFLNLGSSGSLVLG